MESFRVMKLNSVKFVLTACDFSEIKCLNLLRRTCFRQLNTYAPLAIKPSLVCETCHKLHLRHNNLDWSLSMNDDQCHFLFFQS